MKIYKGDTVKILYGKDRGRTGIVVRALRKEGSVVVEGINVYKKHVKGDGREQESEIVDIIKPLPVSKVMLICPSCDKPSRVAIERENGKKYRVCKKCSKRVKTGEAAKKKVTEAEKKVKLAGDVKKKDEKPVKAKKGVDTKVKTKVDQPAQSYRQTGDR